jgi:hypothetical protein
VRSPVYALAKELARELRRYPIKRDGFCSTILEAARTFAGRFGGDLMPVEAAGPSGVAHDAIADAEVTGVHLLGSELRSKRSQFH